MRLPVRREGGVRKRAVSVTAILNQRRGIVVRSEIVVPERIRRPARGRPEVAHEVEAPAVQPERKRSMFDGLKLGTGRVVRPEASPDASAEGKVPARERAPDPVSPEHGGLTRAADRYARVWSDVARMREHDLPILEHQKVALRDAGAALDAAARPGAVRDLQNALEYDPATRQPGKRWAVSKGESVPCSSSPASSARRGCGRTRRCGPSGWSKPGTGLRPSVTG